MSFPPAISLCVRQECLQSIPNIGKTHSTSIRSAGRAASTMIQMRRSTLDMDLYRREGIVLICPLEQGDIDVSVNSLPTFSWEQSFQPSSRR